MNDANDYKSIDWRFPTVHMLAGWDAGKSVYRDQVASLQQLVVGLRTLMIEAVKNCETCRGVLLSSPTRCARCLAFLVALDSFCVT